MTELKYCTAVVEEINDPDKLGKIQVRLLPQMKEVKKSLLPWYDPLWGTGKMGQSSFNPPEIGSVIIVFPSSETLRNGYYMGGDHIEGFFDYSAVKTIIDSASEVTDSEYPNVKFLLHPDGTVEFHNNRTGDRGIVHSSGSYQIIDKDGNFYFVHNDGAIISKDSSGITIQDSTAIVVEGSSVTITGGSLTVAGNAVPTGTGCFLGIKNCLFTGAPIAGETITGT